MLVAMNSYSQLQHSLNTIITITDTSDKTARPEIVAVSNRVFVLYLSITGSTRTFNLKIYNNTMDTLISSRILVTSTSGYGTPTDIRVTSDGQYLYAFYETIKTINPGNDSTSLWGAKYTLDDNFTLLASTPVPITRSKPGTQLTIGGEKVDDPAPLLTPTSIYVITRLQDSIKISGNTIYRVREFDKNNFNQISPQFDLNLSDVANGRGRVTSLFYWQNNIYMALTTTVSDMGVNENSDDGAQSDIILVKMQPDWTYNPVSDVFTLSAELNDRENFVSGLFIDNNFLYITYKQAIGAPPTGQQNAWIKIYDNVNFILADTIKVKTTTWGPTGEEIRPSLNVFDNKIYSGQSMAPVSGNGNAKVFVYDFSITSIKDHFVANLIQVYPNPSNGEMIIEAAYNNIENNTVEIYKVSGEKVFQSKISNQKSGISLKLQSGLYFYEIKNQQNIIGAGKILIQ